MKKLIAIALITIIAGCNTVDGVGQDVSGASKEVKSWF